VATKTLPATAPAIGPPARRPGSRRRRWSRTPYLFAAGAAGYLLLFTAVPLGKGIALSFTNTNLLNPAEGDYVGTDNYTSLLASERFWNSVWTTLVYSAATVVCSVFIGTVAALLINRQFPGRTVLRAILTSPWAVPTVAVYLVFRWIYNDESGVLNRFTGAIGLGEHGWLTDPRFGMFSVLVATVWKVTPFVMIVILAALQSVSADLYEAARIDGADGWGIFRAIVLPHLMPTLRVVALLMTIWSFRRFEIIFLLTGGGPVDRTNTIVINVYREAFNNSELGLAAAIGALGLVLSLAITLVYFVLERRAALKDGGA